MIAPKVIAQLLAADAAPEWMSTEAAASGIGDASSELVAMLVWLGPGVLLSVAVLILLRTVLKARPRLPE